MKTVPSAIAAVLVLASPLAGVAQNAHRLQPNEHPTNLPGVTTIEAPPAGFDPIAASDEDLAYHGFPPRPNQATEPNAYATWVNAMNASKTRVVPQLEQTTFAHGAKADQRTTPAVENKIPLPGPHNNTLITSTMSGYYTLSGATTYGSSSFYYILSDSIVPPAQQVGCSGSWAFGSAWNGLDGFGSPDVLQAGYEFDAFCSAAGRASFYSAWYEWYPYGEVRIPTLPVAPGDEMFIEVWHTSPTQGYAYLLNVTTNQYVEVGFTADPGYSLVGTSAEWIVEVPGPLLHGVIPFWNAVAYTESGVAHCSTAGTPIETYVGSILEAYPVPFGCSCAFLDYF